MSAEENEGGYSRNIHVQLKYEKYHHSDINVLLSPIIRQRFVEKDNHYHPDLTKQTT